MDGPDFAAILGSARLGDPEAARRLSDPHAGRGRSLIRSHRGGGRRMAGRTFPPGPAIRRGVPAGDGRRAADRPGGASVQGPLPENRANGMSEGIMFSVPLMTTVC